MKRRDFLQLTGMSATATLLAGCRKANEQLIPFLVAPEDGIHPGQASYYASTCCQCPAGCGILVRVSEGRAKKIEGNPKHPVNRGGLCARGQAALQELYHPDRIRQPLKRTGPRGSGQFSPISWEEGLDLLISRLSPLLEEKQGGKMALLTSPLSGTMADLVRRFIEPFGPVHHLAWEFSAREWHYGASKTSFGTEALPDFDIEKTQYLLSFGADFIETHLSPVRYGRAFGAMRQARPTVRGRFSYVGSRLSLTAASADRWLPARPGSEMLVALAIARELVTENHYDRQALAAAGIDPGQLIQFLAEFSPDKVAQATGLSAREILATARDFATIRPALAMAGDGAAWQANGLETLKAVNLLNLLIGNQAEEGGVYLPPSSMHQVQSSNRSMVDLIAKMEGSEIDLALIHGANPAYSVPKAFGFRQSLEGVSYLVSFASFMDDTALEADLILPDHTPLESWGDVEPAAGVRSQVTGLMQPVVNPLYDTRAFAEVLLAAGHDLGAPFTTTLPWESYPAMIKDRLVKQQGDSRPGDPDQWWNKQLQAGGTFSPPPPARRKAHPFELPTVQAAAPSGSDREFPLYLQVYQSPVLGDGRQAHLPWLQQLPDPMTTAVWGSWLEINPKTAAEMGIEQGDLVEVRSPQGMLKLPAVLYPGIRPEVVAIPIGQGHRGMGRYAMKRGINTLDLLAPLVDESSGLPAWGANRVRVSRVSPGDLVTAGHPEGSYRGELLGI